MKTIHKVVMVGLLTAFGLSIFFNLDVLIVVPLLVAIIMYNLKFGGDYCEVCGQEYERGWNFKNTLQEVDIDVFVKEWKKPVKKKVMACVRCL